MYGCNSEQACFSIFAYAMEVEKPTTAALAATPTRGGDYTVRQAWRQATRGHTRRGAASRERQQNR